MSGLFQLAMFGHAGAILINLHVTPEVLRMSGRQHAARVNGLRALAADFAAALCIVGDASALMASPTASAARPFLKLIMTSLLPSIVAPSHDTSRRRGRTRLIRLAVSDSPLRIIARAIRRSRATVRRVGLRWPRPTLLGKARFDVGAKPKY